MRFQVKMPVKFQRAFLYLKPIRYGRGIEALYGYRTESSNSWMYIAGERTKHKFKYPADMPFAFQYKLAWSNDNA